LRLSERDGPERIFIMAQRKAKKLEMLGGHLTKSEATASHYQRPELHANLVYSRAEVARMLNLHIVSLSRMAKRGELVPSKCGGRVLYLGSDILAWLTKNKQTARN
jgi:hypothetical protein